MQNSQNEPNLFEQLINRIENVIVNNPVTEYEVLESKIHSPLRFLNKFAKKELVLMHRFSQSRISGALKLIFNVTDKTLKKKQQWTFPIINRLAIYYTLAESCVNSREITPTEEVANESLGRQIISQSAIIFGNEFGNWTNHIQHSFKGFLSSIGSHSTLIYNYFINAYQNDITNGASMKQVAISLKPWTYMPGSVYAATNFLKPIASNVNLITDKYREPFCKMMTNALMNSFRRDPIAFSEFLSKKADIMIANSISEQISSWGSSTSPFTWPTLAVLAILQPNGVLSNDDFLKIPFLNKLQGFAQMKGQQQHYAAQAILVFFQAFTASNAHPLMKNFSQRYFDTFVSFHLHSSMEGEFLKVQKIDFPLAALMLNYKVFQKDILPNIPTSDINDALILAKTLKRFCKISNPFPEFSAQFIPVLIPPFVELLKRPSQDPKSSVLLPYLISSFQLYPLFMRRTIFGNPDLCKVLFGYVDTYKEIWQQFSYELFFDTKFVEETVVDEITMQIFNDFVQFLYDRFINKALYHPSPFNDHIPTIINHIAETLLQVFQANTDIPSIILKFIIPIINHLETLSILFLASSRQHMRDIGLNVLNSLCELIHISDEFAKLNFPSAEYQLLISEARRSKGLKTGSRTISNALKIITEPSQGITDAFESLLKYFESLSYALDPNIKLVVTRVKRITHPAEIITQEWIGVCTVIFAIVFDQTVILFQQMKFFLHDNKDIGQYAVSAIPQAIAPRHLNPVMAIIWGYFRTLSGADNTFIVNEENILFVNNILKLTRGICEQKAYWTPEMINIQIFGQFAKKVVSFSDVIQGEDTKLMCVKLLISMIKLTNERGKVFEPLIRHQLGKTILTWLPESDQYSREFVKSVHEVLALILDDLSLLDCVDSTDPKTASDLAEQQFMFYFASIKSRLDASTKDVSLLVPVLAALLKQNLSIAIGHCISMGFEKNNNVRTAFIASVAAVFKVPESRVLDVESAETQDTTLADILFDGSLDLIELIGSNVPYSRAEAFGKAALEASVAKNRAYDYFARMVDVELAPIDEQSKTTIFRGNAVPARAVGHWPRLVGMEWLQATLRPIFEDVMAKIDKGVHYIIDPNRIGPDENIQENQQNFRTLLDTCIMAIYNAQETMPDALVYASQIIYHKVYAKFGEFAYSILISFLFLRFIIPAFSATQMVGLPALLPDKVRAALLQTSTVIMASVLKGKLDDKGKHLIPFNDLAKKAQDLYIQMFKNLVDKQVSSQNPPIPIDVDAANKAIHSEVYPLIPQLESLIDGFEPGSDLQNSTKIFIQKVKQMGQPISTTKSSGSSASSSENDFNELMETKFPDDQVQQLSEAIYREDHPSPDGTAIVYVHCAKLGSVRDPRIVAQLLFKAIMQEASGACYVVLCLSGFNPAKIPNPTMLLKYSEMPPAYRIRQYLVLEPPIEFAMFVNENSKIFSKQGRFELIDSMQKLTKLLGPIPPSIPASSLETFTEPQATYNVVMNNQQIKIRLHEHSLQIISETSKLGGREFTPVKVIMADQIKNFTRNIALKNHPDEYMFNITMKSGVEYQMRVPLSSPLYDSTLALTLRSRTLNNTIGQVTVDNQTLNWLMLCLAFINMATPTASTAVRKAALDLVYAVFVSFSFGKTITIQKMDADLLPDNMIKYVTAISTDIANNNQSSCADFLHEFFKSAEYVQSDVVASVLPFIVPWVTIYSANPDQKPEIIEKFVKLYGSLKSTDQTSFPQYIWPIFAKNPHCVEMINEYIFKNPSSSILEIVPQLAYLSSALVSKLWAVDYFSQAIQQKFEKMEFLFKELQSIISLHVFDFDGSVAQLVYNISMCRLNFPENKISALPELVTNLLHEIYRHSGNGKHPDFLTILLSAPSSAGAQEYIDGKDNRTWPYRAYILADCIVEALRELNNNKIMEQIYNLFIKDVTSSNKLVRAQALIYSSAFSVLPDQTAPGLVGILQNDSSLIGPITLGLALVNMSQQLASKLFFLGCVLAMRYNDTTSADLISSAARFYSMHAGNTDNILEAVPKEIVDYLQTCTALPISTQPLMSAMMIMACYSGGDCNSALNKLADCNTNEPVPAAMKVLTDDSLIPEYSKYDYGNDLANLSAALILFLRGRTNSRLIKFAVALFTEHPQGLGCFDVLGDVFGKEIFANVNDARFTGLVLRNAAIKSNEYPVAAILQQHFVQMDKIQLTKEQADYLVLSTFR